MNPNENVFPESLDEGLSGLSVRQYTAIKVLSGLAANPYYSGMLSEYELAQKALTITDELIKQL